MPVIIGYSYDLLLVGFLTTTWPDNEEGKVRNPGQNGRCFCRSSERVRLLEGEADAVRHWFDALVSAVGSMPSVV